MNLNRSYQRATNNFAPTGARHADRKHSTPAPSFDTFNFFKNSLSRQQLIWDFGQSLAATQGRPRDGGGAGGHGAAPRSS